MYVGVFFSYVLLGFLLVVLIGLINVVQFDKGIKNGFLYVWFLGIGVILVDVFYMFVVYFGFVYFLSSDFMKMFFFLFGCFVLIYIGIEGLMSVGKIIQYWNVKGDFVVKCFFLGFLILLINLFIIFFWFGIYGFVLVKIVNIYEIEQFILYSCVIFIGILCWDIVMVVLVSIF